MAELSTTALASDANLKGYWRLENNLTDSSSSGYNLTDHSSTDVAGQFGRGRHFTRASSQYVDIADASCPNLEIAGDQSWGCWVKLDANNIVQDAMFKGLNDANAHQIYIDTSGNSHFYMAGQEATSATVITTGTWFFLVGVIDVTALKIRMYVNAVKTEAAWVGLAADTNGAFNLGRNTGSVNYFDGAIDDAFIFNRVLTDAEILTLYTASATARRRTLLGVGQ